MRRNILAGATGAATMLAFLLLASPSPSSASTGPAAAPSWQTTWKDIGTGSAHTCGIQGDNTMWCWGLNSHGQLGNGSTTNADSPQQVSGGLTWLRANLGADYSCAIAADLSLYCWGANSSYQLGQGDTGDRQVPTKVGADNTWRQVSAGGAGTCGIMTNGTLWCWGANAFGQAGVGYDSAYVTTPTQVGSDNDWRLVRAGSFHTCALKNDDTLWCWGDNQNGQLGVGDNTDRNVPTQVAGTWIKALTGTDGYHTCGVQPPTSRVKDKGTLWCWGLNDEGQLGLGDQVSRNVPTQVGSDADWIGLALGYHHSCALRGQKSLGRTLWCWGQNDFGQLGLGDRSRRLTPTMVEGNNWTKAAAGVGHSCAITGGPQKALYCWGSNIDGQLGVGDTTDRLSPTQVE